MSLFVFTIVLSLLHVLRVIAEFKFEQDALKSIPGLLTLDTMEKIQAWSKRKWREVNLSYMVSISLGQDSTVSVQKKLDKSKAQTKDFAKETSEEFAKELSTSSEAHYKRSAGNCASFLVRESKTMQLLDSTVPDLFFYLAHLPYWCTSL